MPPEQVKVWTTGDRLGWVYHCPVCGEPHRETTATGNVILMIDAGCPVEEDWDDV